MMIHDTLLCALELQVLVYLDLYPLVVPKLSHPSEIHAMVNGYVVQWFRKPMWIRGQDNIQGFCPIFERRHLPKIIGHL
ncbi:hypothetical protein I305_05286 [Cryptococcus gattii E566]|uniref:Uncharacterized protein n=2 Tax=Cryptococcus gattii TaxID=37769 RepID=E6R7M7_CRYGW|nr:Hypothetical Protein CGB_F0460W [Cryptococcus gattii WM276]ADV22784.1 Hypothetical Protein CGB_F0460W [Cryptococcus gattii WM276]KIR82784.1 hypothetical protein I306_00049 [Cryptococcus gattii EJB2]KIY32327.1 hypothetical protein I305_05286 [Cryptococcus gattii E566]KJE04669.1 hypothetical protein I311_01468 [Cryptococcus gattii NT-10]